MRPRVGVYGGMFDPVHAGHLDVARLALDALALERVIFMPCKTPNHRAGAVASGPQRLQMLQLAFEEEGEAQFEVSDLELGREGVSYSVDTLAQLHAAEPATDFVFIMGQDSLASLHTWERWQAFVADNLLAVVSRPGVELSEAEQPWLRARLVDDVEAFFAAGAGHVVALSGLASPLSSTQVRRALGAGESLKGAVSSSVGDYIDRNRLYSLT